MTFQTAVNLNYAPGIPGEILFEGPTRCQAAIIHSASAAYNIVGATAYTTTTAATDGVPFSPIVAAAGGTGVFAGILANPKVYTSEGTSSGTLAPTMTLPNDWNAELLTMGYMVATLPAACAVGDLVLYDNTTGALSTIVPNFVGVGSIATAGGDTTPVVDTLTITGTPVGALGVGSQISGPNAQPVTVLALGSGTGGAGTYIVTPLSQTAASGAITAASIAPSGKTFVPRCVVDRYSPTGAGLAVIKLTN